MLSRFEKARIIGARSLQLSMGAPLLIEETKGLSPADVAKLEFESKVLPLAVVRRMPNGAIVVLDIEGEVISS